MNKKGFIGIGTVFVMILVSIVLMSYQNGLSTESVDKLIETMDWNKLGNSTMKSLELAETNSSNYIATGVIRIAGKAVDFFGYTIMEISKLAMKIAQDNPNIMNWKVLFWLIILSMLAPLIYPVFMIIVSIILIIKEWLAKRKERKLLNND